MYSWYPDVMAVIDKSYFIVDVETGGFDPETSSLLSFHGIKFSPNSFREIERLDIPHIKPDDGNYLISAGALQTTNIDLLEHDKKAIPYTEAKDLFLRFFRGHEAGSVVMTGYNVQFDIAFIKKYLLEVPEEYDRIFAYYPLDVKSIALTFQMARNLIPEYYSSCKLEHVAKHLGYDVTNVHNAKVDCELTLELLRRFIKEIEQE